MIVAIGERERLQAFSLAGVRIEPAEGPEAAVAVWRSLPADVSLAILTPSARAALASELAGRDRCLWVVMPS